MPFIMCPNCGKSVSDRAPACPFCNHPMAEPQQGGQAFASQPELGQSYAQQAFYTEPQVLIEHPHTGFGIASFITACVGIVLMMIMFIVAAMLGLDQGGNIPDDDPALMAVGFVAIICAFIFFMGAVLAAAGMFQKERRKVFAYIGLAFNIMPLICCGGLMILGLFAEAAGI